VHYYEILEDSKLAERLDMIANAARGEGRVMKEVARRNVKSYSPAMTFFGFDLQFV
jgi:tRNA G37 N-methylase Trm5